MKFSSLILFAFLLLIFSCSKSDHDNNPASTSCEFFPIAKGQKVSYQRATIANLTPDQIKYYDKEATVLDSFLVIEDNFFYYNNCQNERVDYRRNGGGKVVLFDNSKSATDQVIFSDGFYTVTQHKDIANTIFSIVKRNFAAHELLIASFKPGTGIVGFSFINENSGNESIRYKFK